MGETTLHPAREAAAIVRAQTLPEVPPRKPLNRKQLEWLRKNVDSFAELESRSIAARANGGRP